jgi:prophage regulatory protein
MKSGPAISFASDVVMGGTVRNNASELVEQVTALRSRAAEIAMRIRCDGALLMDVRHELLAALNVLAPLCTSADLRALSSSSASLTSPAGPTPVRLLRIDDVGDRLGLSRSHVWRMVKDGRFPKPRRLSSRAVAWLESDVSAWIGDRPVFDAPPAPAPRARRRPSRPA